MKKHSKAALLVNTFGTLGYISCLTLWGWAGILYVPMLLANERVEQFLLPNKGEEVVAPAATSGEMSPVAIFFALAITATVIVATVIMLLRAPVTIAKTGQSVTAKAADSALPLITKGKPLPAAKKKHLTADLIKLAKLLLILLPVLTLPIGLAIELPLPFDIVLLITSVLAFIALAWFSAQYLFARLLSIDAKQLL